MPPLVSVQLNHTDHIYAPGMELSGQCQIDAVPPETVQAVELSVLWKTLGKGNEDLGVHYFSRRTPADVPDGDLCALWKFATQMPPSPLSYNGRIVKIRWTIRIRVFRLKQREFVYDHPLMLVQSVRRAEPVAS